MVASQIKSPERMTATKEHEAGDLRIWHIPQMPMDGFYVYVASTDEVPV